MICLTKDLLNKGETEYSLRKKVKEGSLFLVEHGVYSDVPIPYIDEAYISKKYPGAIITGLSAFYIYNLTDHIPKKISVATEQHCFPIRREDVSQSYQDSSFFSVGKTTIKHEGNSINIYDKERLLIELIRFKERLSPEIYYEVLNSYRKIKNELDFYKINQYIKSFKNGDSILQKIKEII